MPTYLFNVQTTWEVIAGDEETARDLIGEDGSILRDSDVMLVEVSE